VAANGRRIAIAGRAFPTGGFGRVVAELARGFADRGADVFLYSFGVCELVDANIRVMPLRWNGVGDERSIALDCMRNDIRVLLISGTCFETSMHARRIREVCGDYPLLIFLYAALDGYPTQMEYFRVNDPGTFLVFYTEETRSMYDREVTLSGKHRGDFLSAVGSIGHGVGSRFFRLSQPDIFRARQKILGNRNVPDHHLLMLNANANTFRKRLDICLAIFAAFARRRPHASLVFHTDPNGAFDLPFLARRLNVADRVVFTSSRRTGRPEWDDAELNELYCMCDVGINTSVAEGWGLIAFEHAATGAAQVMTRTPVTEALWRDHAVLVDSEPRVTFSSHLCGDLIVSECGVRALEDVYDDTEARETRRRQSLAMAARPEFQWSNVVVSWLQLFEDLTCREAGSW
jgi:glycosyltransferase involved in cell wall biosynthesis